jgi:hypothetical protein
MFIVDGETIHSSVFGGIKKLKTQHHIRLTAPELANLWTQYMNDSMAICVNKYFLKTLEDEDIRSIYEYASKLAKRQIKRIKEFLTEEKYPIPLGFTDQDINLEAPALFQDPLLLNYLYVMTLHGLTGYAVALTTSSRSDMQEYYNECTTKTMELYHKVMKLMLAKGLYNRAPYVHSSEIAGFVEKKGIFNERFLAGWLGDRRPLTATEISNITFNMNKMNLGKAMTLGFSQTANKQEVRNYMSRGTQLSTKHTEIFTSVFREDNLNAPCSWDSMVTNSTTSPFSDKLIMFHTQIHTQASIAFFGAALAVCMRKDLATQYLRLTGEVLQYAEDGANIMIDNGWLEEPPSADNRSDLASGKRK